MMPLEKLFPEIPAYKGFWQPVYLEPIIGSGEKITVAVVAVGLLGDYKVIQAIRSELLESLYGAKASQIQSMVSWIIESINESLGKGSVLSGWQTPIDGVTLGNRVEAVDETIEGILRQAIRFSASLSVLSLDAERGEDEQQPKRYIEQWASKIAHEVEILNPQFRKYFKSRVRISEVEIFTTFGFLNQKYASNFGLLVPEKLSGSLNAVKARLFDLESLKRANILIKPDNYEIIIGTPSLNDPTLTEKAINKIKNNIDLLTEIASTENISVYRAESPKEAAERIFEFAA